MAEIAYIGFAFQIVGITIQAVDLWRLARDVGPDVVFIQARLEMIRARLKTWMIEWDFESGKHLENAKFRSYGSLAIKYLMLIQFRLTSQENFHRRYPGLFGANARGSDVDAMERTMSLAGTAILDDEGAAAERIAEMEKHIKAINEANFIERWRWARRDGKGVRMVEQVATLVTDLENFFEPPFRDPKASIVFNRNLASKDDFNLASLSEDQRKVIDNEMPLLPGLALLKSKAAELEDRANTTKTREMIRSLRHLDERKILKSSPNPEVTNRETAILKQKRSSQQISVLVEWKTMPSELKRSEQDDLSDDIQDLARLLHTEGKPTELRTLDCVGVVEKQGPEGNCSQMGLLFQFPKESQIYTLAILLDNKPMPSLTAKVSLAKALAQAILFLHMTSWLHKGIRADNILFFVPDGNDIDLAQPRLAGFEYSRLGTPGSYTQNVDDGFEHNIYRHPEHQGISSMTGPRKRFTYAADIYSLGVLLLEVGLWKSALTMARERGLTSSPEAASAYRDVFMDHLAGLSPKMGDTYTDTVRSCLMGDFPIVSDHTPHTPQELFYLNVVRRIEQCCI